jgi:hypothetical protein
VKGLSRGRLGLLALGVAALACNAIVGVDSVSLIGDADIAPEGADGDSSASDGGAPDVRAADALQSGDVREDEPAPSESPGDAGIANACQAGHYTGSLSGSYTSSFVIGIPLPLGANLSFDVLLPDAGGARYPIANGAMNGTLDNSWPVHCAVVGALDCTSKQLADGGLQACSYCSPGPDGGCALVGFFEGAIAGPYASGAFHGTWSANETASDGGPIRSDAAPYGGSGSWDAAYVSPDATAP